MKKFILNTTFLFMTLLFIILSCLMISSKIVKDKNFENHTSESNTLFIKENLKYDILLMGISHARNFSRHKNHLKIEEILNSKIMNIGQGGGACGVNEQLFYYDYFLKKGNKGSKILYVLSPPMLFSKTLPLASNTFDNEVFDFKFFSNYLFFKSENKQARIMSYLQSKFHPSWFFLKPFSKESEELALEYLDTKAVEEGQNLAYNGSELNMIQFQKAKESIEKTIQLSQKENSQFILLIPPALFGKWRGHDETYVFAKEMQEKYTHVKIFDAAETVLNPEFYYDNHHLNTKGVNHFTINFLKKYLEENKNFKTF